NSTPLSNGAGAAIQLAVITVFNLCTAALLYLFLAPGLALSAGAANRRTMDLELALKGKLLRRPVTGSLVAGLLTGGLLEMVPNAVAASGVFPGASINVGDIVSVFGATAPALDAFLDGDQFMIFVSFALLIPAAAAFVKRAWFQRILVFVIALVTMTGVGLFHTSAPALIVASLLQAWLLVWLYRNFGLLAV